MVSAIKMPPSRRKAKLCSPVQRLWRLRKGQSDSDWRGTSELGLSEYAEVHPVGLDAGHRGWERAENLTNYLWGCTMH